jgi:hypothetical protein
MKTDNYQCGDQFIKVTVNEMLLVDRSQNEIQVMSGYMYEWMEDKLKTDSRYSPCTDAAFFNAYHKVRSKIDMCMSEAVVVCDLNTYKGDPLPEFNISEGEE